MSEHERILEHLRAIRKATTPGVIWDCGRIVEIVQNELDAIKELLKEEESD